MIINYRKAPSLNHIFSPFFFTKNNNKYLFTSALMDITFFKKRNSNLCALESRKMGTFTTFKNSEDLDEMPQMHGLTSAFTAHV